MKIYVNDQELDSKLETEKTLGEVYLQIKNWAESQGKFLIQCLRDGSEAEPSELQSIPITDSTRLDFYIGENLDILVATLLELDRYIDVIGSTLFGRDSLTDRENTDLKDGIVWIVEVLEAAKNLLKLDYKQIRPIREGRNVNEVIQNIQLISTTLTNLTEIEIFLDNLRDLKLFIMNLINKTSALTIDVNTLKEVIHAYSENMDVLKKEFIRVNENFQSGKDALAGELLVHSSGRLQVLLNSLASMQTKFPETNFNSIEVADKPLNEIIEKLKNILEQVANSLDANDIVMAGDLLEYELPDYLDSLVPYLKEIKKFQ
jgi:hypothetical protein